MDLAILIGVWFPYTIGKTLSLLTLAPRQVLSMINWPIRIVRFISDPIADAGVWLIKDYLFPRVVSILRVLIAVLGSLGGLRVFDAPTAPQAPPSFVLPLPVASNITVPALVNHTQLALDWLQLLPLDNSTAEHFAITFAHWFGRWSSLVEGDSARSRVVAILMGYVWVLAFTAVYVSYTSPTEGREVARVIRRELRQQLIMAKASFRTFTPPSLSLTRQFTGRHIPGDRATGLPDHLWRAAQRREPPAYTQHQPLHARQLHLELALDRYLRPLASWYDLHVPVCDLSWRLPVAHARRRTVVCQRPPGSSIASNS